MAKFSTRGLKVYLLKGSASPTALNITGATKANPCVVTVTGTLPSDGDIVQISGTGWGIDGRAFEVANATGQTFQLKCSDTTKEGTTVTAGKATPYSLNTDFATFCINSLGRDAPAGDTIDVSTFCASEQVAGSPGQGTLTWGGPIDVADPGFVEMMKAVEDGVARIIVAELPAGNGKILIPVEINQYSDSFGLNAAGSWSGGAVVKARPTYTGLCA